MKKRMIMSWMKTWMESLCDDSEPDEDMVEEFFFFG